MNERLLSEGRFIRNAFLPHRRRVSTSELTSVHEHDREVELVDKDTAHPRGHIYDEIVEDSQEGRQHIRLVRTTKPYNPDFLVSAHILSFLFPDSDYSKRIVTPSGGDANTWKRFFKVTEISAREIINFYRQRGLNEFSLLVGASFNPYADTNLLRTQSVKAAHLHTLLITDDYLQETHPFIQADDFTKFLAGGVLSHGEIRKDYRRFFPNHSVMPLI